MRLSVIIPVCMQSEFMLRRCFDSVLGQTEPDLELLAVNDAPGDEIARRLFEEYRTRDSRFHGIHQSENGGVSLARNTALDAAQGDFIGFVDSDDAIQPEFYRTLLDVAEKEHCDMVSAEGYWRLEEDDPIPESIPLHLPSPLPELPRSVFLDRVIWNRIYRRSAIEEIRFAPELFAFEDMVFLCRALLCCKRSAEILYPGYCYYHYRTRNPRPWRKTGYAHDVQQEALKMLAAMRQDAPPPLRKGLSYLILRRVLRAALQTGKCAEESRQGYLQDWNAAWQENFLSCAEDFPVSGKLISGFLKLPYGTLHRISGTLLRLWVEIAALPENWDRLRRMWTLRRAGGMLAIHE